MIRRFTLIVGVGFAIVSCGTKDNHSLHEDEISGTYTMEYSYKVFHPDTGIELGIRMVRDTIFIRKKDEGYEVSNNKWNLNDYDREGWRDMLHGDDRPMPTYKATFEIKEGTLNPSQSDLGILLYFDLHSKQIYKEKKGENAYLKIK